MPLKDRITEVKQRIEDACARSGRSPDGVQLIAVTKYVSLETTQAVLDLGIDQIGENRWQDAKEKWEALGHRGTWHFIGHLQTNKVKDVIGRFRWLHSLDRLSLAKEIEKRAAQDGRRISCLIQLNVSGEESKHGMEPKELSDFIEQVLQMKHLDLRGLMTMAPYSDDPEEARPIFRELRNLQEDMRKRFGKELQLDHLSMGMSNDFEVAIEEGATMVRLGSVLVGKES